MENIMRCINTVLRVRGGQGCVGSVKGHMAGVAAGSVKGYAIEEEGEAVEGNLSSTNIRELAVCTETV